MQEPGIVSTLGGTGGVSTEASRVLKNTYWLLSLTLGFSALTAFFSMSVSMPPINPLIFLGVYFALMFAIHKTADSAWGLLTVFAFTGFMGFTLGPILNLFMATSGGTEIVMLALGGTGFIFFGLSGLALVTKKDFSFIGKFLFAGLLVAFVAAIANIFFQIPALALAISSVFLLLSSGMILYQTSSIINGGERNYIMATVTLYVSLYNIFISLLHLISAFSGDR